MLYTTISDQQLDEIVREIQLAFPTCGNTTMQGHLVSRGICIQQHRVGESQRRVDPSGSVMRRLPASLPCQWSMCAVAYRWEPQTH